MSPQLAYESLYTTTPLLSPSIHPDIALSDNTLTPDIPIIRYTHPRLTLLRYDGSSQFLFRANSANVPNPISNGHATANRSR